MNLVFAILTMTTRLVINDIKLGGELMNNNENHKEKILEKSRQSQQDEGIEYAVRKGMVLGNYYTEMIGFALVIFAVFAQQTLVMYAILILMGANAFGDFLAKYRYFRQKRYMVGVILFGAIFGGVFAFLFVRDVGILQGWWS